MANDLQVAAPSNLPTKQDASKLLQEWEDRLIPSEAVDLAGQLLEQFPNCKAEDGFIRRLSEVLMAYPRSVAVKAVRSHDGVATQVQFLSIQVVKDWCDNKVAPLQYAVDWNRRAFREREPAPLESEALKIKTRAWLDRDDPESRMLSTGQRTEADLQAYEEEEEKRQRAFAERKIAAGLSAREREYRVLGLKPVYADQQETIVLSLSLLLSTGWRVQETVFGGEVRRELVSPTIERAGGEA